ncbi:tripeptidyl-peptidase 1 [Anopheles sinensis]|uniref:Tripeptidyl-peptidase 1 n=1 Tax=Anopheles sinensis TaxID=74873 RepID=A0A084WPW0_ANOSI|nr:tripeptidyl-peptidase 1 [Anopheles sinensis]
MKRFLQHTPTFRRQQKPYRRAYLTRPVWWDGGGKEGCGVAGSWAGCARAFRALTKKGEGFPGNVEYISASDLVGFTSIQSNSWDGGGREVFHAVPRWKSMQIPEYSRVFSANSTPRARVEDLRRGIAPSTHRLIP